MSNDSLASDLAEDGTVQRSWRGYARRIDALFRARFPILETRIFEVEKETYLIAALQDAAEIAEEFDQNIRFVTVPIALSNTPPTAQWREIEPLSEAEAGGAAIGVPLSLRDFDSLVMSRFPDLPLLGFREEMPTMMVLCREPLGASDRAEVRAFIDSLAFPMHVDFAVEAPPEPSSDHPAAVQKSQGIDGLVIRPARRRIAAPAFVREDEAFWFANVEAAASGEMTLGRFPGFENELYRCYCDFSTGSHVNLRQQLLLYDQICCSLPLAEYHDAFLADQRLSDEDLLHLIGKGRLRIVSTQPEERLRMPFLETVAERHPQAILGRRATAMLLLADIARTAESYRLADPAFRPALRDLSESLAKPFGASAHSLVRELLWPIVARRQSIAGFLRQGTISGPVRDIAERLAETVRSRYDIDIELEAMVGADRVHLGHALNATVFAAVSEAPAMTPLMQSTGTLLNFYRDFNTRIAPAWLANARRRASSGTVLPPIPIFEFDPKIPLTELLDDASLSSTRSKGRALLARLAELPEEERSTEIDGLVDKLRHAARRRDRSVLTLDNADTAVSIVSTIYGLFWPPLLGATKVFRPIIEQLRRIPSIDRMVDELEQEFAQLRGVNEDLHFLSRISRVAELKRPKI